MTAKHVAVVLGIVAVAALVWGNSWRDQAQHIMAQNNTGGY